MEEIWLGVGETEVSFCWPQTWQGVGVYHSPSPRSFVFSFVTVSTKTLNLSLMTSIWIVERAVERVVAEGLVCGNPGAEPVGEWALTCVKGDRSWLCWIGFPAWAEKAVCWPWPSEMQEDWQTCGRPSLDWEECDSAAGSPNPSVKRVACCCFQTYYSQNLAGQDCNLERVKKLGQSPGHPYCPGCHSLGWDGGAKVESPRGYWWSWKSWEVEKMAACCCSYCNQLQMTYLSWSHH